jgi:hypothetical protein
MPSNIVGFRWCDKPAFSPMLPAARAQARLALADPAAYNREMLHTLPQMLAPAVMERVTLLANHVLSSDPWPRQRLLPHAGKSVLHRLPRAGRRCCRLAAAGLAHHAGRPARVVRRRGEAPELTLRVAADNRRCCWRCWPGELPRSTSPATRSSPATSTG